MTTLADTGASHEGAARSLYAQLELRAAAGAYERAYTAYRHEGDRLGAARAARMLGWVHGNIYGDWAVQSGWIGRAISLLEEAGQGTLEQAWVHAIRGTQIDDFEARCAHLRRAIELGRRHHDANVEFEALGWLGLILVLAGRIGEGMPMLDQALAAICADEVSDLAVVEGTFCGFYYACEHVHDVARADQWIRAAEDVTQKRGTPPMGAFCRAHYGGILTAAGRWRQAEAELVQIAQMFGDKTAMRSFALVRLADLRVRQGRFEEAEQLLGGLHEHHDAVRPLAALHLGRGETAIAAELLERTLEAPGFESAARSGPLLAVLVDTHLAGGSTEEAAGAAARLNERADTQPSHYLRAAADFASGRVSFAKGSPDARGHLTRALDGFAKALMPFEVARARLELARAASNTEVAVAEAKEALAAFERLEASRHADEAAALLRSLGAPVRVGPKGRETLTNREEEVLALVGHGLSNPEIAERLFISRKTVEHHVGHILAKLALRSRAEAAAYAARESRPTG